MPRRRAEQVLRFHVAPHGARLPSRRQQRVEGGEELVAGIGELAGAVVDHGSEGFGHVSLGCHVVDEPLHPLPQGHFGRERAEEPAHRGAQLVDLVAVRLHHQCLSGGEVAVEGADADAGLPGDRLEGHLLVRAGQHRDGHPHEGVAVLQRVGPQPAAGQRFRTRGSPSRTSAGLYRRLLRIIAHGLVVSGGSSA